MTNRSVLPGDNILYIHNWDKFSQDDRTSNIVAHMGNHIDMSLLDPEKINIMLWGEFPNVYFSPNPPSGVNTREHKIWEESFDYILSPQATTVEGLGHTYSRLCWDQENVLNHLEMKSDKEIDEIRKDIDVAMVSNTGRLEKEWYSVMKKFNHRWCSWNGGHKVESWHEKQRILMRSKIEIVWTVHPRVDFRGVEEYIKSNLPWLSPCHIDGQVPQAKPRPFEAASAKCLMLCYKSPFAKNKWPYHNPIEEYFVENEDFIYFEDSRDLEEKISEISTNIEDEKYQKIINSAYSKLTTDHDIVTWYENNIVPIAEKERNNE